MQIVNINDRKICKNVQQVGGEALKTYCAQT